LDTQPPAIVWEATAGVCASNARAEALLRRGLASSVAPGTMWVVNVHLDATGRRAVTAESEITDDDGMTVAHRSLVGSDCDGLARATGVWASLVLDTQVEHHEEIAKEQAPPAPVEPDTRPPAPWPAPEPPQPPPPEADWYLHHADERNVEVGAAAFLMTGAGAVAVGGVSPFIVVETGHGVYLRPSIIAGESLTSITANVDARAIVAATRVDACVRMPGLYTQHRGIQLDACLGADLGFNHYDGVAKGNAGAPPSGVTTPYSSFGPSLEMRGELGSALAATLRGLAGANLFREGFTDSTGAYVDSMAWTGRVELALSWGLR
jgi:hypothetical protein